MSLVTRLAFYTWAAPHGSHVRIELFAVPKHARSVVFPCGCRKFQTHMVPCYRHMLLQVADVQRFYSLTDARVGSRGAATHRS